MNISKANLCSTLHLINENEHCCKLGTIANILKGSASLPEEDQETQEIHSSVSHRSFLFGHFCQSVFFLIQWLQMSYRKFPTLFDQVRQLAMIEFSFPS